MKEITTKNQKIPMAEIEEAIENYTGYCTVCCAFTRDQTEPDAENYDCPDCGNMSVMGAEQALLLGVLT